MTEEDAPPYLLACTQVYRHSAHTAAEISGVKISGILAKRVSDFQPQGTVWRAAEGTAVRSSSRENRDDRRRGDATFYLRSGEDWGALRRRAAANPPRGRAHRE